MRFPVMSRTEQDAGNGCEDAADDVEDCGTTASGGGKFCACLVTDGNRCNGLLIGLVF